MNVIDIVLLVILAIFLVLGFRKGLLKEVVSIIGLVVAFWAAMMYTKAAAGLVPRLSLPAREAVAFLAILIGVFLVFQLAGFLMRKLIRASPLAILDRLGGVALGLLKGGLLLSICLLVLTLAPLPKPWADKVEGSYAARGMRQVAPMVYHATKAIGPGLHSLYEHFMAKVDEPTRKQAKRVHHMIDEGAKIKVNVDTLKKHLDSFTNKKPENSKPAVSDSK
jgi:membrane protein required for colicin V production